MLRAGVVQFLHPSGAALLGFPFSKQISPWALVRYIRIAPVAVSRDEKHAD
jgi:hypothetical protein